MTRGRRGDRKDDGEGDGEDRCPRIESDKGDGRNEIKRRGGERESLPETKRIGPVPSKMEGDGTGKV